MNCANSAGVPPSGSTPCVSISDSTSFDFSASLAARDSLSTISRGVPAGASNPIQMPAE